MLEGTLRGRELGLRVLGMLLAFSSGCSSPDATCASEDLYAPNARGELVTSRAVSGEVILSATETSFSTTFEAALDELPEVWVGEEPLHPPTLVLTFELEYTETQPSGAELPPVTAVLDTGRVSVLPWDSAQATTTLGGSRSSGQLGVAPFVVCESGSTEDCCPYGASRCAGGAALQVSREADVFPPVRVRYTATASAQVYECLEDEPAATWTLEETGR